MEMRESEDKKGVLAKIVAKQSETAGVWITEDITKRITHDQAPSPAGQAKKPTTADRVFVNAESSGK